MLDLTIINSLCLPNYIVVSTKFSRLVVRKCTFEQCAGKSMPYQGLLCEYMNIERCIWTVRFKWAEDIGKRKLLTMFNLVLKRNEKIN